MTQTKTWNLLKIGTFAIDQLSIKNLAELLDIQLFPHGDVNEWGTVWGERWCLNDPHLNEKWQTLLKSIL